ncbi:Metal transporter CNNM4 [Coccomyxa sp. Obi]|nr:Metal transporter CNNM4 [Coccomyxa sp. Obi]
MGTELLKCIQSCDLLSDKAADCLADSCGFACNQLKGNVDAFPIPVWAAILISLFLVPLTGLFAGLTLGLLSLDRVGLRILVEGGDAKERRHAEKILPVREQGNQLLCTLLLGNVIINSALSILLADLTTGPIGLLTSTAIILIFGEIIPQSICSRHGLEVGAHSIWLVHIFTVLLAPIAWPMSLILDWCLGRDIGTVFSQQELKSLIDIHVHDPDAQAESGLTNADRLLLIGALEYKDKRVKDVMTALEHCFLLEVRSRLNFATMLAIYKSGFTRIPVYESSRQNIKGILYVKDLILVDPDDETELSAVLAFRGRNVASVREDVKLDVVFKEFMSSNNHMLLVRRAPDMPGAPDGEVVGLITLEDVMEELIQAEIVDETDIYEDVNRRVLRRGGTRADVATFLTMFEHKLHASALSSAEVAAVAAFLQLNVEEFAPLMRYDLPLKGLISHAEIIERHAPEATPVDHGFSSSPSRLLSSGSLEGTVGEWAAARTSSRMSLDMAASGSSSDAGEASVVLYTRGEPSDTFTLILQGKALIRTGAECFELDLGPWSVLGNRALSVDDYVPDFDAIAQPPCRMLRIRRAAYRAALEACTLDPVLGYQRGRLGPPSASRQVQGFDGVQAPHGTVDSGSRAPSSAGGASDFAGSSSSLYPAAGLDHTSSSTARGTTAQNAVVQDTSAHGAVPRFGASASSTYSEQHGRPPSGLRSGKRLATAQLTSDPKDSSVELNEAVDDTFILGGFDDAEDIEVECSSAVSKSKGKKIERRATHLHHDGSDIEDDEPLLSRNGT